jgi:hypothetical protein
MMVKPERKDKFREGQGWIKEIIGIKFKPLGGRDRDISSPSRFARENSGHPVKFEFQINDK